MCCLSLFYLLSVSLLFFFHSSPLQSLAVPPSALHLPSSLRIDIGEALLAHIISLLVTFLFGPEVWKLKVKWLNSAPQRCSQCPYLCSLSLTRFSSSHVIPYHNSHLLLFHHIPSPPSDSHSPTLLSSPSIPFTSLFPYLYTLHLPP